MIVAGASPFAMMPLLVAFAVLTNQLPALIGLMHLTIFGALGSYYVLTRLPQRKLKGAHVSVRDGVLSVDGRVLASRDELVQGLIVPRKDEVWVRLDRKGRRLPHYLLVSDVAEGRALLRSLGLDATQATAEVRCMSPVVTLSIVKQLLVTLVPTLAGVFGGMALGVSLFGPQGAALSLPFTALMLAYLFLIVLAPTRVKIGADGLALRWLWRRRFVRFADVVSVAPWVRTSGTKTYEGIQLELAQGEEICIAGGQRGWSEQVATQLEERVLEAWEAHRQGRGGGELSALERGERDLRTWVEHLRALGEGAKTELRRAFVPLDRLLRVVEDPSQPDLTRAGAAIAAARGGSPQTRDRIRVAASATASPRLRVALERSLDPRDDPDSVAEALAALEEEQTRSRARR